MDRFWTIIRWGALILTCVLFGIIFWVILIHFESNFGVPSVAHLGLLACLCGVSGNIILIWNATSSQKKETLTTNFTGMVFSWGSATLLALLPGGQRIFLPWIFVLIVGCGLLALKTKQILILTGLLFFIISCSNLWLRPQTDVTVLSLISVILIIAAGIIRYLYRQLTATREEMSQLRREVGYLTQTNVRLQNHAVQEKEFILTGERDRIAREFHDTIGHTLTGLVVKLQAIESLVKIAPERVIEELEDSCALVREALRQSRLAVSALRDPESKVLQGRALWLTLCETFANCTGITIQTDFEAGDDKIDDETNAVVYRFIQEALTNAYRHGEATLIDIAVWRRNQELRVRVSDNGHGVKELQEGFGITGIRERVTELKGQVGWRSEYGKGFDIAIILPYGRGDSIGQDTSVDCG